MAKEPVLEFAFSGGIDEATREEIADAARTFPVLENGRQDKRGGYSKRLGYASLSGVTSIQPLGGTVIGAAWKCFAHDATLCLVAANSTSVTPRLNAYSETLGSLVDLGRVPEAYARLLDAPASSKGYPWQYEDITYCNGYLVFVTDRYAAVQDASGTVIRAVEAVHDTTCSARVAAYGTTVVALFAESGTGNVAAYTLDVSNLAGLTTGWVSRGDVATDKATASTALDAQGLDARVAFVYVNNSAGTDRATVKTMTTAVVETQTINTASVTPVAVACEGSSADTLWVAWNQTTTVRVLGLDGEAITATPLASAASILTLNTTPSFGNDILVKSSATTGACRVFANDGANDRAQARNVVTTAGAAVADGSQQTLYNVHFGSKVARYQGRYYALVSGDWTLADSSTTLVLCDVTDNDTKVRPVAVAEPGLVSPFGPTYARPSIVTGASATKLYTTFPLRRFGLYWSAAQTMEIDFAATTRFQTARNGPATFLSSGVLCSFDGTRLRETGFLFPPTRPTSVRSAGSLSPTTGYRWVAVYETCDGDGNWTPSGVSLPSALSSTTASSQYTVSTRPLTVAMSTDVRVVFYRTTDGGSTYFLTGSALSPAFVANDPAAATVSYVDNTTDTDLQANAKLYGTGAYPGTAGAAQDRRAPPGFACLVSYNDMLVGATGPSVWFSGQLVVGESPWFSPLFRIEVAEGGDVTALAAQDGTLYVFKRRSIFAVNGEPPADNGSSGGLGTPRRLAADVGCIDPRSVVVTALGVFFQSERGLELLTRGQAVEWIGEAVSSTLASYPVVLSAVLDSAHALVRFECVASETGNIPSTTGVQLVYDLTLRTWVSVDKVTAVSTASRSASSAAMAYLSGAWRYVRLDQAGTVAYERSTSDGSAHLDGSTWVTQAAETANVHIAGLQGEQNIDRVLALAERHSDHDVTIAIAHDYASSYTEPKTFPAALLTTLGRQWLDRELLKSTSQAIRVRLSDATPSSGTVGTGKGATWVALTFSGERKSGVKRTTSAERGTA